jgi:hypothetical protein
MGTGIRISLNRLCYQTNEATLIYWISSMHQEYNGMGCTCMCVLLIM